MLNCGIVSTETPETRRAAAQARAEARAEAKRIYRESYLEDKKAHVGLTQQEKAELAAIKIVGAANDFADTFLRRPPVCH